MRVEKGVPEDRHDHDYRREGAPEKWSVKETSSAGESTKKRSSSGLPDEEAAADEDDDEDD